MSNNKKNKPTKSEIREHWESVEKGYFDANQRFIDSLGYIRTPWFTLTTKGERFLEAHPKLNTKFRPKSLSKYTKI